MIDTYDRTKVLAKQLLAFFCLFFLAVLVTENYFATAYVHLFMLVGAGFIIYSNQKGISYSKEEEALIKLSVFAFLLLMIGFFFQDPEYTKFHRTLETQAAHLLPLLLIPIAYVIRDKLSLKFLAWCLIIAAVIAFMTTLMAYHDGLIAAGRRGGGEIHGAPIIYGNLAMLYGVAAWALSSYFFKRDNRIFMLLILAGLLGVASSLLSGTRGGWIVLLTLPFFIIPAVFSSNRKRYIVIYFMILIIIAPSLYMLSDSISYRVDAMIHEISLLITQENYMGGSLGSRLAFWDVAIKAFLSSPIWGIGAGEFYAYKKDFVDAGLIPEWHDRFKHAHNEYMSILSGQGLIGVMFYFVFFGWLFVNFKRMFMHEDKALKTLGLVGMVVLFAYFEFSLTESFFSSQLGLPAFYFLISLLFVIAEKIKQA